MVKYPGGGDLNRRQQVLAEVLLSLAVILLLEPLAQAALFQRFAAPGLLSAAIAHSLATASLTIVQSEPESF
jgi:hypothetical protein